MSRWHRARELLEKGITERAFPGAVFGVWHNGATVALESVGRFIYDVDSPATTANTIFDLASVTKVVATTALAMRLWQRNTLPLDSPVAELLPEFAEGDPRKLRVTLKMLLAHTSGLPAHRKLYELPEVKAARTPEAAATAAKSACLAMPLKTDPGARPEYSDIGFIVLGEALLRLTSARDLQEICESEIFTPLGLSATRYLPRASWADRIAPTRDWNWQHRVLQGEVQDENCAVLGGIAGHAGVFGDCADLLKFAAAICASGEFFQSRTVDLFSTRVTGSRALGWDTPSSPSQSGGLFSSRSIGHLGYTGTSLWIDLEQKIAVALLTNRVYTEQGPPNQGIQQIRPAFYDAVMKALIKKN
jgi:CubicO group peptidase (beta-lactamase class C family)